MSCENDLLGYIEGTVGYDGKNWTARIRGCTPASLVVERDILGSRVFRTANDALEAIDQMVEGREQRETDRRKKEERTVLEASSQIDGIFAASVQEGEGA